MTLPAATRVNVNALFPAQVVGGRDITVAKSNGIFTIGRDPSLLGLITTISSTSQQQVEIYDSVAKSSSRISVANLFVASGVSIAGTQNFIPKYNAGGTGLTATSNIYDDGTKVTIGASSVSGSGAVNFGSSSALATKGYFTFNNALGAGDWFSFVLGTGTPNQFKPNNAPDGLFLAEYDITNMPANTAIIPIQVHGIISAGTGQGLVGMIIQADLNGTFTPSGALLPGVVAVEFLAASTRGGSIFGINPTARASVVAAAAVVSLEADTDNQVNGTGSKIGIQVVDLSSSVGTITGENAGYALLKQPGALGYARGFTVGGLAADLFPMAGTTGVLFRVYPNAAGNTIATGIDLVGPGGGGAGGGTLTISGNAWISPGCNIKGDGSANFGGTVALSKNLTVQASAGQPAFAFYHASAGAGNKCMGFIYDGVVALPAPGMLFQRYSDVGAFGNNAQIFWGDGGMTTGSGTAAGINYSGSPGALLVQAATVSTSVTTGALIVATVGGTKGGLGVAGAIFAGDKIVSVFATGGIGYATGAGGAVTQATSKATGVTLNTVTGAITLNNASLAAGAIVSFVLTDSAVAATDLIVVEHESAGTTGAYTVNGRATGAGTAAIDVRNNTAGALAEAIVLRFAVIKSVNA